jgi:hypothetical protein
MPRRARSQSTAMTQVCMRSVLYRQSATCVFVTELSSAQRAEAASAASAKRQVRESVCYVRDTVRDMGIVL